MDAREFVQSRGFHIDDSWDAEFWLEQMKAYASRVSQAERERADRAEAELADYKRSMAWIEAQVDKMLAVTRGGQQEGTK